MTAPDEDRRYHRLVERAWSRLRDRATVLSPREFEVVEGWRRRGIPARIVLEVIDRRARHGSSAGRSLAYLAGAVDEAWSAVAAGRAPAATVPERIGASAPSRAWEAAAARWSGHEELSAILRRAAAEAREGTDAAVLDAGLDDQIAGAAPRELLEAAERATSAALTAFRGRMPAAEFQRTFARARADRLRDALGLPRWKSP